MKPRPNKNLSFSDSGTCCPEIQPWVWVKIKPPWDTRCLIHVSIYQGSHFGYIFLTETAKKGGHQKERPLHMVVFGLHAYLRGESRLLAEADARFSCTARRDGYVGCVGCQDHRSAALPLLAAMETIEKPQKMPTAAGVEDRSLAHHVLLRMDKIHFAPPQKPWCLIRFPCNYRPTVASRGVQGGCDIKFRPSVGSERGRLP